MLTVMGMLLLSILLLRVNRTFLTTDQVMYDSKFEVLAFSLGSSMMDEIKLMAFDEKTINTAVTDPNQLTPPGTFGPESGETFATFDDVDDFDDYTRVVSNLPSAVYTLRCIVQCVTSATPDVSTSVRTWNKKISVTVTSPSMTDTVRVATVISYWFFR